MARAKMSVVPPAAKGTTMRTALLGQEAWAKLWAGMATAAAKLSRSRRFGFMGVLRCGKPKCALLTAQLNAHGHHSHHSFNSSTRRQLM